ncbi:MAG TPA: hypothetical protein VGI61_12920 [Parafilimonas sp.]|jgi:hypothetical protein
MKKAAIIFLVFIYAFSIAGVAVKADYCCNHLKSIKLVLADGAKDKEGCCKVKFQSFKVKDVHAAADIIVTPALHYTYIQNLNYFFKTNITGVQTVHAIFIHDPPLLSNIPTYISNCVFRI